MRDSTQLTRIKLQKGRHLVKRGEIWYLETCVRGLQERHSLGTGDLKEATRLAAVMQNPDPGRSRAIRVPGSKTSIISIMDIHGGDRKKSRDLGSTVPLKPSAFLIMLAIGRGQAHGYAIMREIERRSWGQVRMGPGTLYRSAQRMLV